MERLSVSDVVCLEVPMDGGRASRGVRTGRMPPLLLREFGTGGQPASEEAVEERGEKSWR